MKNLFTNPLHKVLSLAVVLTIILGVVPVTAAAYNANAADAEVVYELGVTPDSGLSNLAVDKCSDYLQSSGGDLEWDSGSVYVYNRQNNWEGFDIKQSKLNIVTGVEYDFTITGRVATQGVTSSARIVLCSPMSDTSAPLIGNAAPNLDTGSFTISQKFTFDNTNLPPSDKGVRVSTNDDGKSLSFYVDRILITKAATVTLTVNKDGNPYTSHGKTFYLKQGASSYTGTGANETVSFSTVPAGTYSLYDGTTDTGLSVTVSGATGAVLNYYTVTFSASHDNATGSSISAAYNGSAITSGAVVLGGKTLTLTATGAGATTYTYAWGGTASGTSATYTTTVNAAVSATCTVTGTGTATITGISVKSQPAKLTYTEGQTLDLTGLAVTLSLNDSTTQDVSYTDFGTYGVSMSYTGGGATAHGNTLTVAAHNGKTITLTCNTHTAQTSALTVNAAVVQHTITASAGTGGSISPSGSVTVNNGGSQSFTITASSGYAVSSVTVDGASVGAVGSYTFSNVTGDHTIHATFYSTGGGSSSDSGRDTTSGTQEQQVTSLDGKSSDTLNDAIGKAADAVAAAAEPGTGSGNSSLDVKLKNVSEITPKNVAVIIKKAKELGTKARVSSDTISENGRAVEVRVTVDPEQITETVKLDGYVRQSETRATTNTFQKYFENETAVIRLGQEGKFGQAAKVAAKLDLTNFDTENIFIYRYDRQSGTYSLINTEYRIDANGYLHFYTDRGGYIIVSSGPLTKRADIQQNSDGTIYYIAPVNPVMLAPDNAGGDSQAADNSETSDIPVARDTAAEIPAAINADSEIPTKIYIGEAITPVLSKNSPVTSGAEAALMVSPALSNMPEAPKSDGWISVGWAVVMAVSILLSSMTLWAVIPRKDDPLVSVEEYRKRH